MVHKVNEVKFSQKRSSTLWKFYSKFQRKILKKKKVKDWIRKTVFEKKHQKTWVYTNHWIFLKEESGWLKLHFPLKDFIMGEDFIRPRRKIHREKIHRNSFNKILSKVRRNTSPQKRWEILSRENTGKNLKISKTGMADR